MRVLVTGGGGFLGGAIVRRLVERGDQVRSLSRGDYPRLKSLGVEQFQADLTDSESLARAVEGCDVVFHVAAKAGIWGPYAEYHRVNVTGTENVLDACRRAGVRRLVYTSSPSVVFNGHDMEGADESAPYPAHYHAAYPETKAKAEQLVLQANGPELATVAIRPHLIWGPGDNNLIPRLVARARSGRLRQIGKQAKLVDTVYIDNAADAHFLAADRLTPTAACAGKAYFIAQGEPLPLWDLINRILDAAGLPPVSRRIPATVAYAAGALCEGIWTVLGKQTEPPMTRFLARELSTAHWFNLEAARRDLGYRPSVSVDEGLRRLRESFQQGAA
jgi:nucleoside-diphosphate-sugar epimerase